MTYTLGIDPGGSGGAAIISDDARAYEAFSFTNATEMDIHDKIKEFSLICQNAFIEAVHSMPGQGVASTFKFGRSYGFIRGCVIACNIPLHDVSPIKWQTLIGCRSGGDKNITKAKAQVLFPKIKITHATADALLIAEYGRRVLCDYQLR
jgi:crossover junction endodeoxyribonuclease RuvC